MMLTHPTFTLRNLLVSALIALFTTVPLLAYLSSQSALEVIQERGELRVATRYSPSSYFVDDGQPGGFEYELAKLYADQLGVALKIVPYGSLHEIYEALRLNNVHLAAAGLTRTPERAARFAFGPSYQSSQTELIYRSGNGQPRPASLAELAELDDASLEVVAHSSHAEQLKQLAPASLSWREASAEQETLDLLSRVDEGELDYTLADAAEFNINRTFFPRLSVAFALTEPQPIAWMFKRQRDSSLGHSLQQFFADEAVQASIQSLKGHYFNSDKRLDLVDSLTFRRHMQTRLPRLRTWFEQAAAESGVEWQLLAAIAYQESHWNPRAVSPTGVRGIMMLTRTTAKSLGIEKRTDPEQSIRGGALYFAGLRRRLPERLQEPDRTLFALAAYNVGRGHLEDARILAQRAGRDPDRWEAVREFLPLLSQAKWYRTLKHGFARGQEPVVYVRNIQRYRHQLELESRLEAIQLQPLDPAAASSRLPISLPDTL